MTIRRQIKDVIDGDTFEVRNRIQGTNRIRIAGRNSPEKGERGYQYAKNKMEQLIGETVTLIPKARSYGRLVAEVRHNRRKIR